MSETQAARRLAHATRRLAGMSAPSNKRKPWRDDDKDVLKALAERVLEQWLSRIGVTGKAAQ